MLSKLTKIEELELTPEEAEQLGQASAHVLSFYEQSVMSAKTLAWVNLGTVAAGLYGPRLMAYKIRAKKNGPQKVVNMQPFQGVM